MKIAAFTDSHGSLKVVKDIKKKAKDNKVDLVICAGDISVFGNQLNQLIGDLSKAKIPVFIIHGNHEDPDDMRILCEAYEGVTFLHGKLVKLRDKEGIINFIGWGGGGFSAVDNGFEKFIKKAAGQIKKGERTVLITHAPPYGTAVDKVLDSSCGNKSIKSFILDKKPLLAVVGHIHECNGKREVVGKTLVINPGPFGKVLKV